MLSGITNGNKERFATPRSATYSSSPGFVSPYIYDSKIQFEVTNVYFYKNNYLNTLAEIGASTELNYINTNYPGRLEEGMPIIFNYSGRVGHLIGWNGRPGVATSGNLPIWDPFWRGHLLHEIAHCMGLGHTYPDVGGGGSDWVFFNAPCGSDDYLHDVFPPNMTQCPNLNGPPTPPQNPPCNSCYELKPQGFYSNNTMGGDDVDYEWLSPLQMGRRIRQMHLSPVRFFAKDAVSGHVNPWVISADEVWDFDIQMYKDVVVKAPATLTIKCRVAMAMEGKIIVEKGARLVVDGGEVTGWCKSAPWRGIEAEGTYGVGQLIYNPTGLAQDFGIVKVINGGTISKAHTAIANFRSDNNFGVLWGNQGGIIQCDNANFIDNRRDIQMISYQNAYGNDLSKFVKCNFQLNSLLVGGLDPISRVTLWEVQGVQFLGCKFEYNAGNAYPTGNRGNGIYSENARFTVDRFCVNNQCLSPVKSIFRNFEHGVRVGNTNPLRLATVTNSEFFDNTIGVYFNTMNNIVFENNYIQTLANESSAGLYLNNCKYYNVRNNTIHRDYTALGPGSSVGIYANNSKAGAHSVYRNNLYNHQAGIGAIGDNSGVLNTIDGLLMNCNDFIETINQYDIALLGNLPTVMETHGQVVPILQNATNLVRNRYAAYCNANENTWYIQLNSAKPVQHGSNANLFCRPDVSPLCKDAAVNVVNSGITLNYPVDCPSSVVSGGCNPPCLNPINTALSQAIVQTNTLSSYYVSKIEQGSAASLISAINSSMGEGDLKNLLLQHSPYLSDEVLVNYFNRTDWPLGHGVQIHNANKPVSAEVWQSILQRNLPSGIMSQLIDQQNQYTINAINGLMQEFNLSQFRLQSVVAEKLNYFLSDSLPQSADSVIAVLHNNSGKMKDANEMLVFAYLNKGDTRAAYDKINEMSLNKSSEMTELLHLLTSMQESPQKEFILADDPKLESAVENIAKGDIGTFGRGSAQALLRFVKGVGYHIPMLLPETEGSGARLINMNSSEVLQPVSQVFPNPAKDGVFVTAWFTADETAECNIIDVLGKTVQRTQLKNPGENFVSLNSLPAGVYIINLKKGNETLYTGKLIKQD